MPTINGNRYPDKLVRYQQIVNNAAEDDIATKDFWLVKARFSNTTNAAITVTLRDKRGTPLEMYKDVPIAANSVALEVDPNEPVFFSGGADIRASAADLEAEIVGYTKP